MRFSIKRAALDAIYLCVVILCSLLSFPLGAIPVTLQIFGIFLIILLSGVDSIIILSIYILMGSLGLPVFAGGFSGISAPTYGFLIGFLLSAIVIFIYTKIFKNKEGIVNLVIKASIFLFVTYLIGLPYCMIALDMNFVSVIIYFLPFIGIDIVKLVIVILIYKRIKNVIYFE